MPQWAQLALSIAAVAGALTYIWSKILHPILKFSARSEEMVPLLRALTVEFRDTPGAFAILDEIVKQVRTDSGSSLLDIVNRLDDAAKTNAAAAEVLKVGVQSAKELAEQDRVLLHLLIKQLDRIAAKVDGVADDLAASHKRADDSDATDHGAVADASAKSPEREQT